MSNKKRIVLKFGGTSVASRESRLEVVRHVRVAIRAGYDVAIVVSAMGRIGDPYATDTLLSLVSSYSNEQSRDLLISCGEVIGACVVADELSFSDIPAIPMSAYNAGITSDGNYGNAEVTGVDVAKIEEQFDKGIVPVVTGFQAVGPDGHITTMGRGGSDTSAVELAGYIGAEKVIIYTDVPGIAKVDPLIVPNTEYMKTISYTDMLLLAEAGAKVIHPRAVNAGMKFNIPIFVASTFDDGDGTEICGQANNIGLIGATRIAAGNGMFKVTVVERISSAQDITRKYPGFTIEKIVGDVIVATRTVPNSKVNDLITDIYYKTNKY